MFAALLFVVAFPITGWNQDPAPAERPRVSALSVTHLANEGFLIRAGGDCVLVDALFDRGVPGYARVPAKIQAQLLAGKKPFHDVDLVLATHVHRDHFDAGVVAQFLRNNPKARFLSTPQVRRALEKRLGGEAKVLARVQSALPEEGKRTRIEFGSIRVDVLSLTHGRMRRPPIENIGFVVHLAGRKFLHVGDSEATGSEVRRYELAKERIDVAFLPCWYLAYDRWAPVVKTSIAAQRIVLMHLPRPDASKVYWGEHGSRERYLASIQARFRDAIAFSKAGDTRLVPAKVQEKSADRPTSRPRVRR